MARRSSQSFGFSQREIDLFMLIGLPLVVFLDPSDFGGLGKH